MELHPTKREPPPLGCRSSRSAFFAGDLELPVLLTLTTALGAQEEAAAAALMVPVGFQIYDWLSGMKP